MNNNIIWMDGGFLFEINKQYDDLGQQAVLTNQSCILDLYENYINLGCRVITTNNYGFKPSRSQNWLELCRKSKQIFKQLKLNHPHIKILGSLPPFFPSYKYKPVNNEFKQFYKTLIPVLNEYVDEFLIETAISIEHINSICTIYQDLNIDKKMNVSFYPANYNKDDIRKLINTHKTIDKLFINCCNFHDMQTFYYKNLEILLKDNNLSFGFYLNKIDEKKYSNDQNVKELQEYKHNNDEYNKIFEFSKQFKNVYIGGCCGYGIKEMDTLINYNNNVF